VSKIKGQGPPTADAPGWDARFFAQPGTGYTNPGQPNTGHAVYLDRLAAVVETRPDVVIVQGSMNDAGPAEQTQAAAVEVFAALRARLPEARIVAVGPVAAPALPPGTAARAARSVAAAALAAGIPFIDPVTDQWMTDRALYADGVHLNDAGYAGFTERLVAALRQTGIG
jgi:acyl-CoA thioesterase-1